jgi:hypothetical protein
MLLPDKMDDIWIPETHAELQQYILRDGVKNKIWYEF